MKLRALPWLLLLAAVIAPPLLSAQGSGAAVTQYVDDSEPRLVAFLPSALRDARDATAANAREQVAAAVADSKRCLGANSMSYEMVFADRIVLRRAQREESFDLGTPAVLVGALLIRPGANARILFAGSGPEALTALLRSAAAEYFDKPCEQ